MKSNLLINILEQEQAEKWASIGITNTQELETFFEDPYEYILNSDWKLLPTEQGREPTELRDNFWDWASENHYEFDTEAFYDLMEDDFKNNGFNNSRWKWLFFAISKEKRILKCRRNSI